MLSYEGNKDYIFISYCHRDEKIVLPVIDRLINDGFRVWYDEGIDAGEEWPEIVADHLQRCAVFIAFISKPYLDSFNCKREIDYAVSKRRPFISVMLEDTPMTPGMEMQLSSVQSLLMYRMKKDEFIEKLYQSDLITSSRKAESSPLQPESHASKTEPVKKKTIKIRSAEDRKKRMTAVKIVGIISAVIAAVVIIRLFTSHVTNVVIHGTEVALSDTGLSLVDATVSSEDIKEIAKMQQVLELEFKGCDFSDSVQTLNLLPDSVEKICFENCTGITDYSWVSNLPGLKELGIKDCVLTDDILATIDLSQTDLRRIDLSENPGLTDLSPIEGCQKVYNIKISGCAVTSLSSLRDMSELKEVYAERNGLTDLDGLQEKEVLEKLVVSSNKLRDLDEIEASYHLKSVLAGENELESINALSSCTGLKYVDLHGNRLTDVSALAPSVQTLQSLDLRGNDLSDLGCLSEMPALSAIFFDDNGISDMSFLSSSTGIEKLSGSNNRLTSASIVESLTALKYLDLSGNEIKGTVDFENNNTLEIIFLQNNSINEVIYSSGDRAEVFGIPISLNVLAVFGNPLYSIKDVYTPPADEKKTKSGNIYVSFQTKEDAEAAGYTYDPYAPARLFLEPYIDDCPYGERASYEKENSNTVFTTVGEMEGMLAEYLGWKGISETY